jgi:hypothetical protein
VVTRCFLRDFGAVADGARLCFARDAPGSSS